MIDRAQTVEDAIWTALQGCGAVRMLHAEARTAAEAAAARGTPLAQGAKSLFMKTDRFGWTIIALPGDRQLSGPLLRGGLGVRRYRMATADELEQVLGLQSGAVPPFGVPVLPTTLLVDAALATEPMVAFACARRTVSVRCPTAAWLDRARPFAVVPLGGDAPG